MAYGYGGYGANPWMAAGAGISNLARMLPMIQQIEATAKIDDALQASGGDPAAAYGSMVQSGYGSAAGPLAEQARAEEIHRGQMGRLSAEQALATRREALVGAQQNELFQKELQDLAFGRPNNEENRNRIKDLMRERGLTRSAEQFNADDFDALAEGRYMRDATSLKMLLAGQEQARSALLTNLEDKATDDADFGILLDTADRVELFDAAGLDAARKILERHPGQLTDDEREDLQQLVRVIPATGEELDPEGEYWKAHMAGAPEDPAARADYIAGGYEQLAGAQAAPPSTPAAAALRAGGDPYEVAAGIAGAEATAREAAKGEAPTKFSPLTEATKGMPTDELAQSLSGIPAGKDRTAYMNELLEAGAPNALEAWQRINGGTLDAAGSRTLMRDLLSQHAAALTERGSLRDEAVTEATRKAREALKHLRPGEQRVIEDLLDLPPAERDRFIQQRMSYADEYGTPRAPAAGAAPRPGDPTPEATSATVSYAPAPGGLGQSAPRARFATGRSSFDGDATGYLSDVLGR